KMTSVISDPRRALADCSPMTHLMASTTLDLPQPLGPMMAVMPSSKSKVIRSANDLKPYVSSRLRRIAAPYGREGHGKAGVVALTSAGRHGGRGLGQGIAPVAGVGDPGPVAAAGQEAQVEVILAE